MRDVYLSAFSTIAVFGRSSHLVLLVGSERGALSLLGGGGGSLLLELIEGKSDDGLLGAGSATSALLAHADVEDGLLVGASPSLGPGKLDGLDLLVEEGLDLSVGEDVGLAVSAQGRHRRRRETAHTRRRRHTRDGDTCLRRHASGDTHTAFR